VDTPKNHDKGSNHGHGVISKKNETLFQAWEKEAPADAWECERCRRIEKIQGNENRFVKKACLDANL
jgi:deoxyribonuclease-1